MFVPVFVDLSVPHSFVGVHLLVVHSHQIVKISLHLSVDVPVQHFVLDCVVGQLRFLPHQFRHVSIDILTLLPVLILGPVVRQSDVLIYLLAFYVVSFVVGASVVVEILLVGHSVDGYLAESRSLISDLYLVGSFVYYFGTEPARGDAHDVLVQTVAYFECDLVGSYVIQPCGGCKINVFYEFSSCAADVSEMVEFESGGPIDRRLVAEVILVKNGTADKGFMVAFHELKYVYLYLVVYVVVLVLHRNYLVKGYLLLGLVPTWLVR